jgi:hypothetical protein
MPGRNGLKPRQEIIVGRFYLTRFVDKPTTIYIENDKRDGMEVPEPVFEMLIRNFWEANTDDIERRNGD